jgi:hypothetical protein
MTPLSEREKQAFFLRGEEVSRIAPSGVKAPALPDALVVAPGEYEVFGESYRMQEEGLYRFLHPMNENRQCIVFREDVWALMSAVSWLASHGYRDNQKSYAEKLEIARAGKLVVTCGDFAVFVTKLFASLNLRARVVGMTTLIRRNGYNDGHVLNEVFFNGRWIVYDADQGQLYRAGNRRLNLLELIESTRNGGYTNEPLTASVPVAVGHFARNGYAYDLWMETCLSTPALYREIMLRLMGVPIVMEDDIHYFTAFNDADRCRVGELYPDQNLHFLPLREFRSRYYGDDVR